jgi:hypothetical protein
VKTLGILLALAASGPSLASRAVQDPAPLRRPDGAPRAEDPRSAPVEVRAAWEALAAVLTVAHGYQLSILAFQEPADQPGEAAAPKGPAPEATAAWSALVAATSTPGDHPPISAFELHAQVTARQGVQRNDLDEVTYRYLAPHFIRFGIGPSRETGRGPGKGQAAYWLKDGQRVTPLEGRAYQQDRDLVRRMTTIAQNVIALSNPAKLTVRKLELRAGPPPLLPAGLQWHAERMTWIELLSPDFDLYREQPPASPLPPSEPPEGGEPAPPERLFRVQIGADRKTHQPRLVVLREEGSPGEVTGEPLLFELQHHQEVNGYVLPHLILVRGLEPSAMPAVFQESPSQEIGVVRANLAPEFAPGDFQP